MTPGSRRCSARSRATWDFVLARVAIDFRAELKQEDGRDRAVPLESIGRSSVRTREEIRKLDGTISAEADR